ncbi:MAG: ATP-grasp domain-containing protein [Acidobacteria bacterium]|nr:ATP-grasp domain-containing protein [Acidobacteriota bacterium]
MNVIFVAPYFLPATVRFIDAVAGLPNVRAGLISQDPLTLLPADIRSKLKAHHRVQNGMDPRQILQAARALSAELGPVQRLFGALEDLQVALAQVREALSIPGLSVEAANNFRDKSTMKSVLRSQGVPCARHCLAHTPNEAMAFVSEVGFPIVIKPRAGAGARNTFQVDDAAALKQVLSGLPPNHHDPTMMEEFIQGEEHSFDCISIRGEVVWHSITRYYPTPLEVLKNPWIQWCVLLPREIDAPEFDPIRLHGQRALKALGMGTGLSHMEWFRRRDGSVAISEVAARPPGAQITTLHSVAHDMDLFKAWAKLMVFETFDIPQRKYAAGVAFLRGSGYGRVKRVEGLEQAQRDVGSLVIEHKLPQAGQSAGSGYEGQGYVILRHTDTEVVKQALKKLITTVRVVIE